LPRTYYGGGEGGRKGYRAGPVAEQEHAPPNRPPSATAAGLSEAERAMVKDARAQRDRLGRPLQVKTKAGAGEGEVVRSGFGKRGGGPARTQKVLAVGNEIGHTFEQNASLDAGVPGQAAASHAEKLAAIENPGRPLAVDRDMCADCFEFFRRLAVARKTTLVIHEPNTTWIFRPDGIRVGLTGDTQTIIYPDGSASAGPAQ
jgi:hypothetical protein